MTTLFDDHLNAAVAALPPAVVDALKFYDGSAFVAGGFLRAIVAREKVSDIDIFTNKTVDHNSLVQRIKVVHNKSEEFSTHETPNATSIHTNPCTQVIRRSVYSGPASCIASFDFAICQAALWWDEHLKWRTICAEAFYPDLASRHLRHTGYKGKDASDPMNSAIRVLKFYERGYVIDYKSYEKIILNVDHDSVSVVPSKELLTRTTKTY